MSTVTVTSQQAYEKALAASAPGDTIVVEGVLQALSLKASTTALPGRKPNLTLDLTKAEIISAVRTSDFDGIHLIGGVYRGGITLSNGKNFSLTGGRVLGTDARLFNGVSLQRVVGAKVIGVTFLDCLNGVVLSECQDVEVVENTAERFRKDANSVFASQRVVLRGNKCSDARPQGIGTPNPDHGDAVQMFNAPGKPACADILIEDNTFDIRYGQGITQTWKEGLGDPRFSNIVYRNNRVKCGSPVGFGMLGVDRGLLDSNVLEGYPDAPKPVRFFIDPRCTEIVWKGRNLQKAHLNQAEIIHPPTVAEPPADPRIAELEAELALSEAENTELAAELQRTKAELSAAVARLDAIRAALT